MFTVCPKCALTLVVTAADLRIAQGYVRCGRCLNVFNALARLSEERPAAAPEPLPAPPESESRPDSESEPAPEAAAQHPASPEPPAQSSALDETGEIEIELDASAFATSANSATPAIPPPPAPAETAALTPAQAEAVAPAAGTAASELGAPSATSEEAQNGAETSLSPPQPIAALPTQSTAALDEAAVAQPEPTVAAEPLPAPAESLPAQEASTPSPQSPPQTVPASHEPEAGNPPQAPDSPFELETKPPRAPLAWQLAAALLALALALQIINHYRGALAAHPTLGGPLRSVYAALGVKLAPHWNIHAYDVRQLGASVAGAAAGEIIVRASVMNGASRAQPLPLLRVTLQDRFGNRIAARDVPPGDYLPSPAAPGALLAAGSRVDATMAFVDPGPQAVGFEIDACLPQPNGAVACAHGPE